MADEFTREELTQVIRGARVFNSSFSEEDLETLTKLEKRLGDSGFLRAVNTLLKLEEKKGMALRDVHEEYEGLVREDQELDKKLAAKRGELSTVESRLQKAKGESQQAIQERDQAKAEVQQIKREQRAERKNLSDYREWAANQKTEIQKGVEERRREADVSEKDVVNAGQVKAEVTRHGFTLELALGLAQEFAGYSDARERLAEALKRDGTLSKHLANLDNDIRVRTEQLHRLEDSVSSLGKERAERRTVLSQLDAEIAHKRDVVDFYYRYVALQSFMEYLGTHTLSFHHCQWCGAKFSINHPGGTWLSTLKCPWCGMTLVEPDNEAYAAVSMRPGTGVRLLP